MSTPPDNPYAAPTAVVADVQGPINYGSPVKAVTLGILTDIGGTLIATFVIGIMVGVMSITWGMTVEQMQAATENPPSGSFLSIANTVVALGFSLLGGYVCARIAKRREYRLGLIMAVIDSVLGALLFLLTGQDVDGVWVFDFVASFAFVVGGAHLGALRTKRIYFPDPV